MEIDFALYTYLSENLTTPVYWGRIDSEEQSKEVVNFFRLPSEINNNTPIKGIVYQISIRAPEIDIAQEIVNEVENILRGWSGQMENVACSVVSIQELGSLYEEDGQLMHIPLQVAIRVVE